MTEQDKEALRKIQEFAAMSPEEKVTELQRQLKAERARAAGVFAVKCVLYHSTYRNSFKQNST